MTDRTEAATTPTTRIGADAISNPSPELEKALATLTALGFAVDKGNTSFGRFGACASAPMGEVSPGTRAVPCTVVVDRSSGLITVTRND